MPPALQTAILAVTDWDLYEQLLLHSYSQVLCTDSKNHPVMVSEVSVRLSLVSSPPPPPPSPFLLFFNGRHRHEIFSQWNTKTQRAKLSELMFEKLETPALYFGKDAVLSAFASGRSTALVINVGAGCTRFPISFQ